MGHVTTHLRVAAVLVALVLAVAGCTTPRTQPNPPSGPGQAPAQGGAPLGTTLRIVAGSEHRSVLDQVVVPWCEQHRYDCQYTLMGSVDQARLLTAGGGEFEAYWFASSVFAQLGNTSGQLTDVQPMFLTPIVYAGWKSEMERLGFGPGADVTVQQVLDAVEGGQTKVWATNPTQSNSGATMYFAFLNHFAGNGPGQALTAEQLASAPVKDGISRFVRAMDRTPPSTGTMMRECLEAAPASARPCSPMRTWSSSPTTNSRPRAANPSRSPTRAAPWRSATRRWASSRGPTPTTTTAARSSPSCSPSC